MYPSLAMSIIVTPEEIEQFRANLSEYPEALGALDAIEDCEGDLEDAAIVLAIQAGQEPDTSERWIDGLAKRWRHIVCQADLQEKFSDGLTADALTSLAANTPLPLKLATPVAIYVVKTGVDNFCQPFQAKLK